VDIYYDSVSPCAYCSINPITGESTRPSCATCGGTGKQTTTATCYAKGVINTFINNKGYIQFGQEKLNIIPEGEARLTLWLGDVLENTHSITGSTYLDSAKSVSVEGNNYHIKNYQRIGIEDVKVCVVILDRIK
jgi:hypothetical protein